MTKLEKNEGWVEGQAELAKFIIEVFENED